MIEFFKQNKTKAIALGICVVTLLIRLVWISEKGLIDSDQGVYGNEAKTVYGSIIWLYNVILGVDGYERTLLNLRNYLGNIGATFPYVGKPGFNILIGLSYLVFGLKDYSVLMVSALLGTATIWIVYLTGRMLYNAQIGLIAALIMAVSKWANIFSLSGYAEMSSTFFGSLGIYFFIKSHNEDSISWREYILSGLMLGAALTINYKMIVFLPLMLAYQMFYMFWFGKFNHVIIYKKNIVYWFSVALPVIFLQVPFFLATRSKSMMGLLDSTSGRGFTSYFDSLLGRVISNTSQGSAKYYFTLDGLASYFEMLWTFEGTLVIVLLAVGFYVNSKNLFKQFEYRRMILFTHFLSLTLIWSLFSGGHPSIKASVMILPFFAIISAIGAFEIAEFIGLKIRRISMRQSVAAIMVFIFVVGMKNSWEVITFKSGYKASVSELVGYIKSNGGIFTSEQGSLGSILKFYMGNEVYNDPSLSEHFRVGKDKPDSDFIFISPWFTNRKPEKHKFLTDKIANLKPIFVVDNPYIKGFPLTLENRFIPEEIRERQKLKDVDKIFVYDLRIRR